MILTTGTHQNRLSVSTISARNFRVSGADWLTSSGADFGIFDSSITTALSHTASVASSWMSATAVYARTCSGGGTGHSVRVTAAVGEVGSRTHVISYDTPGVSWLVARNIPSQLQQDMPWVSVSGSAFAVAQYSVGSRSIGSAAMATE